VGYHVGEDMGSLTERPISFNVLESNVLGKVDILGFTTIAINSKVRKKDFGWVFSFIKFDRVSSFPCILAFSLCLICVKYFRLENFEAWSGVQTRLGSNFPILYI